MTRLLEIAIEAVRRLPSERQDDLARMTLEASQETPYVLTDEERAAVEEGLADAKAGRFASDESIRAIFAKHRTV